MRGNQFSTFRHGIVAIGMLFTIGTFAERSVFFDSTLAEDKDSRLLEDAKPGFASSDDDKISVKLESDAKKGFELILGKRFLPPDFDRETFEQLWKVWPNDLREQAAKSDTKTRRRMIFERYGLSPRPSEPEKPLQFSIDAKGKWTFNCFTCHAGTVLGKSYPGSPNNRIALQTLYDDLRILKPKIKKPLSEIDVGSLIVPMGTTIGTTNAVNFGIALMNYRDKDLKINSFKLPPRMVHHDMDAPPWWHFKKRKMLYIDGFTEKSHRALMPFVMVKQNNAAKFKSYEDDFRKIYEYLKTIEPPKYPYAIDKKLTAMGEKTFNDNCSSCHGTYGEKPRYSEVVVDIDEIKTDRVRFRALSNAHRKRYGESWLANYGKEKTVAAPAGYVAPPLDGLWASAPYFHNGSVPTLWEVLNPKDRPKIWKHGDQNSFDKQRIGLAVERITKYDSKKMASDQRRKIFDTSKFGKSNQGHDFPDSLSTEEKKAVLEYLKSL